MRDDPGKARDIIADLSFVGSLFGRPIEFRLGNAKAVSILEKLAEAGLILADAAAVEAVVADRARLRDVLGRVLPALRPLFAAERPGIPTTIEVVIPRAGGDVVAHIGLDDLRKLFRAMEIRE